MRTCVYGRYSPAQPIINLQSFKSIPDSLKQRFKAFAGENRSWVPLGLCLLVYDFTWTFPDCKGVARGVLGCP